MNDWVDGCKPFKSLSAVLVMEHLLPPALELPQSRPCLSHQVWGAQVIHCLPIRPWCLYQGVHRRAMPSSTDAFSLWSPVVCSLPFTWLGVPDPSHPLWVHAGGGVCGLTVKQPIRLCSKGRWKALGSPHQSSSSVAALWKLAGFCKCCGRGRGGSMSPQERGQHGQQWGQEWGRPQASPGGNLQKGTG